MRGVYTALITPFDASGKIDWPTFRRLLQEQADAGVTGVIPCGTTGETPVLTVDEKKALVTTSLQILKGSGVKVLAGTGSNNTSESIEHSRWASDLGTDGVLIVTPYYNKPSQAGLEAHFRAIADAVSCEVMLYNVPARTGISLTAATVTTLATHPRIRSLKEATGNVAFASEIIDAAKLAGVPLDLLAGDDSTFLPLLSIGAVGVVSVASNLFPRAMVSMQRFMEEGKLHEAKAVHQKYYPLFRDLFIDSNPVPVKFAMELVGLCGPLVRAPLAPLSTANADTLRQSLERCGVSPGSRL
jgi:4-hydroxy-tetrahydrodipicolinate synthase